MNAKKEFPGRFGDVLCAEIETQNKNVDLKMHHTQEEFDAFLNALDFEYDSGYGGQELFGTVWYTDGTYSDRGEYDGSEWWAHHVCPDIPESLEDKERKRELTIDKVITNEKRIT